MLDDTRVGSTGAVFVDVSAPVSASARVPDVGAPARITIERDRYQRLAKPCIDFVGAFVFMVLLLPVLVVVAIAVRVSLGPGIIFKQQRIGQNGTLFSVYKFRTMGPDSRKEQHVYDGPDKRINHKHRDDPRLTKVGKFLRHHSFDELPQLLNVIKGDMSLVGPRPELSMVVAGYQPWQHARHVVKPGLTGFWQVYARGDGRVMHECTDLDVAYVRQISFATDMKILFLTIPSLLRKGGY